MVVVCLSRRSSLSVRNWTFSVRDDVIVLTAVCSIACSDASLKPGGMPGMDGAAPDAGAAAAAAAASDWLVRAARRRRSSISPAVSGLLSSHRQ